MAKLTAERCNGIKTGYWSPETKETVVQKLGEIEKEAPELIAKICDYYCFHVRDNITQEQLNEICEKCPVNRLVALLDI